VEAKSLLGELRPRKRAQGVDHVLVDSYGRPWKPGSFSAQFNASRTKAGIVEPANLSLGIDAREKHLHDVRGTFCTHLCGANLTNEEIARIMGWSPLRVDNIRRVYVDDTANIVALARRIGASTVKQPVKLRG
jgi:DNA-binding CsgD family transcriptional regulator